MFKKIKELLTGDSLLDSAFENTFNMLKEDMNMFNETVRSLRQSDTGEISFDIYEKDNQINKLQREVRRKVITHVSVGGITKSADVSPSLAVTSIVIDVERIADYTKNIWELAVAHPKKLHCGPLENEVSELEKAVKSKFEKVIDALSTSDEEKASNILHNYIQVSKNCNRILENLIREDTPELSKVDTVVTALYVRYLKRINGHLSNITTSVVNPFHRIGFQPKPDKDSK
ncbi:MAG: hypothetical protein GY855_11860 [candidate division Zixibacteria bacterium]|nr:hypothetical protein [candidate division Zixibacteria bacterium]